MKRTLLISILLISLNSFGQDTIDGELRELPEIYSNMSAMKLQIEDLEAGLSEGDETYWCEGEHTDHSKLYIQSLRKDVESRSIQDLDHEMVDDIEKSFQLFYDLCELADADLELQKQMEDFMEAFHKIADLRERILEENTYRLN